MTATNDTLAGNASIQALQDRNDISDVLYRYSACVDSFDAEGLRSVLADDIWAQYGNGDPVEGGDALASWITEATATIIWQHHLLNVYTAKKLGLKTTGNAARGLAGNPGIGAGNFFLRKGERTPQQIIGDIKRGLYITQFLGFGVNMVTGDFSRGASGLWIENGELAYPVEEITVAGNLKDMLNNISEIGRDLEFRGSTAAPTLRIDGMTIAGE